MKKIDDKTFNSFLGIMFFYILLSYVIFPVIFFYFVDRTLLSAGNGLVVGSILSIILWYTYGCKMV